MAAFRLASYDQVNQRRSTTRPDPLHQAKTHLSRLLERGLAGEEVVIARGRTPVVRLVPIDLPLAASSGR